MTDYRRFLTQFIKNQWGINMSYNLDHWDDFRKKIGGSENDVNDQLIGCIIAFELIKLSKIDIKSFKGLKVLDYGCGTGRASRIMSLLSGSVDGYDPNKYCIEEAIRKNALISTLKPKFSTKFTEFSENSYDLIFSYAVIEHLTLVDQNDMMNNIMKVGKIGGSLILNYSPTRNHPVLTKYIASKEVDTLVEEDKKHELIGISKGGMGLQFRLFKFSVDGLRLA